jgi:hypothetical protein
MRLDVYIENRRHPVEVAPEVLESARPFYEKMDADMDRGWKMGPEFIEHPDRIQRAQIAASKLLLALEQGNESMVQAMAGYILARIAGARRVHVDTSGEPLNTEILGEDGGPVA